MSNRIAGNLRVDGDLTVLGAFSPPASSVTNATVKAGADIARSKLAQLTLAKFDVNLADCRVWDAMHTVLPGTSAADDLALVGGTFGTNAPMVKTYDVKAAGAQTLYARVLVALPPEYDDAETVKLRIRGGMETTVADTSATVDVEAYEVDGDGGVGSDLCTTSAQSINSLTFADKDFDVTATGLVGGDVLDIRIAIAVNDGASGTTVIAALSKIQLLCDIRG